MLHPAIISFLPFPADISWGPPKNFENFTFKLATDTVTHPIHDYFSVSLLPISSVLQFGL